jgi:hypothetical protein
MTFQEILRTEEIEIENIIPINYINAWDLWKIAAKRTGKDGLPVFNGYREFRLALRRMERKGTVKTRVIKRGGKRTKEFTYPLWF